MLVVEVLQWKCFGGESDCREVFVVVSFVEKCFCAGVFMVVW